MAHLLSPENLIALLTLTAMEVVLGIDNIVFISILVGKLPAEKQNLARRLGLILALGMRILLLLSIKWVMGLTKPLLTVFEFSLSGKSLILFGGGLFLIAKATHEIYEKVELADQPGGDRGQTASMTTVILQIMALDVVFSLDSVITAVGMAREIAIMVIAVIIAIFIMLIFAQAIGDFVNAHPSMKILALAFLILIGVMLTAEGLGQHVSKGYIYSAMAFSLIVELLNMRFRSKQVDA